LKSVQRPCHRGDKGAMRGILFSIIESGQHVNGKSPVRSQQSCKDAWTAWYCTWQESVLFLSGQR
jgi:hypothetical protein